jgi:hypothetical protein
MTMYERPSDCTAADQYDDIAPPAIAAPIASGML